MYLLLWPILSGFAPAPDTPPGLIIGPDRPIIVQQVEQPRVEVEKLVADAESRSQEPAEGLITRASIYSVEETIDRLEALVEAQGLTVFERVDHAQGAHQADLSLRPTQLLIFGSPVAGTPLMQCSQTAGIDLPMKALAWEDDDGNVWLTYTDPDYLARRHRMRGCEKHLRKVGTALDRFSREAAGP